MDKFRFRPVVTVLEKKLNFHQSCYNYSYGGLKCVYQISWQVSHKKHLTQNHNHLWVINVCKKNCVNPSCRKVFFRISENVDNGGKVRALAKSLGLTVKEPWISCTKFHGNPFSRCLDISVLNKVGGQQSDIANTNRAVCTINNTSNAQRLLVIYIHFN